MDIKRPESQPSIPPHAKRVFKGVIFEAYQWEQELYDGSTATFEKLKRLDTAVVLPVTTDGKIILTRQEQPGKLPFYGLAGGRIEDGEDVAAAAERELLEETGYKAEELVLLDAQQPLSKLDWAVYTFVGKNCRKVQEQQLDAGEKISLELVTFDEFMKIVEHEEFKEIEIALILLRSRLDPEKMHRFRELLS